MDEQKRIVRGILRKEAAEKLSDMGKEISFGITASDNACYRDQEANRKLPAIRDSIPLH
jgi:type I restriction enzyme M protein